jgi:hypothetical protein
MQSAIAITYDYAFWMVAVVAMAVALFRGDKPLGRATMVAAAGQIFIIALTVTGWLAYDLFIYWFLYLAMFVASITAALWKPSNRYLVVFAGVNMAGAMFAMLGLAGIILPMFGVAAPNMKVTLYGAIVVVAVCELLLLAWGAGNGLARIIVGVVRTRFSHMGKRSRSKGVGQ